MKKSLHKFKISGYKQPKKIVHANSFKEALALMKMKEGHVNQAAHCADCACFSR